jgi:hypothetical protein
MFSSGSFSGPSVPPIQDYSSIPTIEVLLSIPHHGAVRPAKLYLLVGCLLTCLCTLSRHQASVWALGTYPSFILPQSTVEKSKQALRKCLDSMQHEGVPTSRKVAVQRSFISSRCDHTVALKHINMGGCSYKNQELACEVEWCVGIGEDRAAQGNCQQECEQAQTELESCIEGHVAAYLEKTY